MNSIVGFLSISVPLAGLEIPLACIITTGVIVFFFFCFLFRLGWLVRSVEGQLKSATATFSSVQKMTPETVATIGRQLVTYKEIKSAWSEFEETFLEEENADGTISTFNTAQAEHYFAFDKIVEPQLHMAFYSAVPGIFTAVGLLGTFLSLFAGIGNLHVIQSGQVQGIEVFINNLSGKFISSIFGLTFALLFLIFEKNVEGRVYRACANLQDAINAKFPRRTGEHYLKLMNEFMSEQVTLFKRFNSDLSDCVKKSFEAGFEESLSPALERLIGAVEGLRSATEDLRKQKEESSNAAMGQLVEEFRKSLTESAGSEFTKLAKVLEETSAFTEKSNERMTAMLSHIDSVLEGQTKNSKEAAEAMSTVMQNLLDRLSTNSDKQMLAVGESINQITQAGQSYTASLQQLFKDSTAKYSDEIEAAIGRIAQASEMQHAESEKVFQKTVLSLESWKEQAIEKMNKLADRMLELEQSTIRLNNVTTETAKQFNATLDGSKSTLNGMMTASEQLSALGSSLNSTSKLLHTSAEQSLTSVSTGLSQLKDSTDHSLRLAKQQEELYLILDQKLSAAVKILNEALVEYSQSVEKSLGGYLNDFDKHLGDACRKVSGTVTDLDEQLSDLGELLEEKLSAIART